MQDYDKYVGNHMNSIRQECLAQSDSNLGLSNEPSMDSNKRKINWKGTAFSLIKSRDKWA